jgi:hypothetical protein
VHARKSVPERSARTERAVEYMEKLNRIRTWIDARAESGHYCSSKIYILKLLFASLMHLSSKFLKFLLKQVLKVVNIYNDKSALTSNQRAHYQRI